MTAMMTDKEMALDLALRATRAIQQRNVAIAALKRLVGCPDVNLDELSPETIKAVDQANEAIREASRV
jgi:hypothetical protein